MERSFVSSRVGGDEHPLRVERRLFLAKTLAVFAAAKVIAVAVPPAYADRRVRSLQVRFDQLLAALQTRTSLLAASRSYREAQILTSPIGRALPTRPAPSKTPISARATNLIVALEVTSQKVYMRSYQRPTWPGGDSGATIGIGYDVGYVTPAWLKEDWQSYTAQDAIDALATACGVTGQSAHQLIQKLQNVVIDWATADRQFIEQVQPRYVGETETALPNTNLLSQDSLGALVSLVYNRGPSFDIPYNPAKDPLDRYREMRAIQEHMQAKAFNLIPAEIRSMKRIWQNDPSVAGLIERRELEASLFELGLKVLPS